MNLPNLITIGRFFFIPVFVYVYFADMEYNMQYAFGILLLAGITDVLDGYLARTRDQVTPIGKMLDPLADKLLMLTVVLSFLVSGKISWMAAAALFIRDAGMIIGSAFFHLRGKITVPVENETKAAPTAPEPLVL